MDVKHHVYLLDVKQHFNQVASLLQFKLWGGTMLAFVDGVRVNQLLLEPQAMPAYTDCDMTPLINYTQSGTTAEN